MRTFKRIVAPLALITTVFVGSAACTPQGAIDIWMACHPNGPLGAAVC